MGKDLPFDQLHIKEAGSAPVISALCQDLGVPDTINAHVRWDEKQCNLAPGTLAMALVINILHGRSPLYRVAESFVEQDTQLLFGPGVECSHLNDDALGSTLDKIADAGAKKVFAAVALQVQAREEMPVDTLHLDTTARLVYGQYKEEGTLQITRGYNKERRHLKQFKVGLGVNKDGFPVFGEVMDGNLDDKSWNKQILETLPQLTDSLQHIIYVADSAMVTEGNLAIIERRNLRFISRLPATYALTAELVEQAFTQEQWEDIGALSSGKNGAQYRIQEFDAILCGHSYRFVVVHSSHMDKRKLKSLDKQIKQEKEQLTKEIKQLTKLSFACEPDAREALFRFLKEKKRVFYPLSGTVEAVLEREKRTSRGRPVSGEEPQYQETYRIAMELGELDEAALHQAKERLGCFTLISNVKDLCARDLLREYKEQTVVEQRFKFIKHPLYVGPMYLKNKDRMEALSYVILIALMIYIVLQRRARKSLESETEPLVITGGKTTFSPTGNKILEVLRPVKILCVQEGHAVVKRFLPENYHRLARVLNLIGLGLDVYLKRRGP
jgi:transposase